MMGLAARNGRREHYTRLPALRVCDLMRAAAGNEDVRRYFIRRRRKQRRCTAIRREPLRQRVRIDLFRYFATVEKKKTKEKEESDGRVWRLDQGLEAMQKKEAKQ